jgi:energy-coupling factor transporter transmembrane protein EcfT
VTTVKWMALLLILAVPVLSISERPLRWFLEVPRAVVVWALLFGLVIGGITHARGDFATPNSYKGVVFSSIPLIQALGFLSLYWLFSAALGRSPVAFEEARYGRNQTGKRHWVDLAFWSLILFVQIGVAVNLCAYSGVGLPSRNRPSQLTHGVPVGYEYSASTMSSTPKRPD